MDIYDKILQMAKDAGVVEDYAESKDIPFWFSELAESLIDIYGWERKTYEK